MQSLLVCLFEYLVLFSYQATWNSSNSLLFEILLLLAKYMIWDLCYWLFSSSLPEHKAILVYAFRFVLHMQQSFYLLMFTIIIILNLFLQHLSKLTGRGDLCPFCRWWTESLRDETFHQFWMPLRFYFMAYLTSCNTCTYSSAFTDFVCTAMWSLFLLLKFQDVKQTDKKHGKHECEKPNARQKWVFSFQIV